MSEPTYDFEGQVALVTRASSGMGLATARAFAVAGASVVLADIDGDALHSATDGLAAGGYQALGVVCDVTDEEQVAALLERTVAAHGRLDMAFNNAGIMIPPVAGDAIAHTGELAANGRLTAAVRAFVGWPFNDEEIAVAEDAGYLEAAGRFVTNLLNLLQQEMEYEGPSADDPAVLGAISAPVLLLLGSDTKPFFTASARHVADHVPNARVHEIPGAGQAAP
jgi:NAD(P)-dependent dehydrogenase (short-subunit alcohol dehydrogenase family)